ncbi:MAG: efflux RND transporter periplasmic adaptor subunit [Vulcanimicrobiaceae bacterium]
MNKRRRNIIILVAGLALLLIVAIAAGRGRHSSGTAVVEQTITRTTFTTKLPENGVIQRPRTQTIATLISGNIGNITVKAGDHVVAGQLLATIENPQLLNSAQTSTLTYRSAVAHAQSANANTRTAVVQAEATLETARARLTQARQDLANGTVSGLGYGGSTAADQRVTADANLSNADTNMREARRIYQADQDLFNQKAISRDQLDQAQAKYQQAQTAFNQARQQRQSLNGQLSRSGEVLRDNLRSAQENYAQAQAQLSSARLQTGSGDVAAAYADAARAASDASFAQDQAARTQLRAPFSGTILSVANQPGDALRPLQPGDPVNLGQTLFTLAAEDAFIVRAKVDEQDVINVKPGQRAQVTGEDFPGKTLSGHIASISLVAQKSDDPSSTARQVITTIRLDQSPSYLRDGMSVDVDILTADIHNVVMVQNDAIVRDHKKTYVYVIHNGSAHKQLVRLGEKNDAKSIVISGLHQGDVIVGEKRDDVAEGAQVQAAPSPSPSTSP